MDSSKPDLNMDQGFVRKPYARKKVIRRPDGTLQVVFEDVRTGKQVNPQGYTVIQSDNSVTQTPQATQGENINKPTPESQSKDDITPSQEILQHTTESVTPDTTSSAGASYYNKPGWMGIAGFVPGPLGLAAKAANLGININNTQAVNQQRNALGFSDNPAAKQIGSALFDQQGYIGDLSTTRPNGTVETAPVSFEATDKNQRTAYTPDEARMHEQLAGSKPATDDETKAAIGTFNNQFPDANKSFLGGLATSAKNLFSGIFGGTSSSPNPTTGSGTYTGGQTPGLNSDGFPSAPSPPDVTHSANNSPDDRDNDTDSGSQSNGGYSSPGLF